MAVLQVGQQNIGGVVAAIGKVQESFGERILIVIANEERVKQSRTMHNRYA
jgi:hypothetical protein